MTLSKIKQANKKSKREARRKLKRAQSIKENHAVKVRNKKMRKLFIEGRREDLRHRRKSNDYVKQLEGEVQNESKK